MRVVRLALVLSAAVLSAQATLQPLGPAGVQTPSTAPATPRSREPGAGSARRESSGRAATAA